MSADPHAPRLRQSLEDGEAVSDRDFDAIYPVRWRTLSSTYWTPVRVAQRAARLLAPSDGMRVLDVGAGVGKLCIVAAASTRAVVTGIEHREQLVEVAQDAARRMSVGARFLHGTLSTVDWRAFDAFYFYNPFYENMLRDDGPIDFAVELSQRRFICDVLRALDGLGDAREGTRVVTYHGLGQELPAAYRLLHSESIGTDALKLWVKRATIGADVRTDEVPDLLGAER